LGFGPTKLANQIGKQNWATKLATVKSMAMATAMAGCMMKNALSKSSSEKLMMSTMQHKRLSVQRRAIVQRFICAAPCDCARKSSQMRSFIEMCKTVLPLQLSQKTAISCFSNPAMHGPSPAGKTL